MNGCVKYKMRVFEMLFHDSKKYLRYGVLGIYMKFISMTCKKGILNQICRKFCKYSYL